MLIAPGLVMSFLLGAIHGSIAHLLWGRQWSHLLLFVLAGVIGCLMVWMFGFQMAQQLPAPGGLPLLEATIVAWVLLAVIAAIWRS